MATVETLLTAEEYRLLPEGDRPTELVRGVIVELNRPGFRHGVVCMNTGYILKGFTDEHDEGHVTCNDSGIVTEHDPDTVRGANVAFYSYKRIPKGQRPEGYPKVAPDAAFEVRSPSDRWSDILEKVAEYLRAGVTIVCVLDPENETARVFFADQPPQVLGPDDELTLPGVLEGFRVPVRRFFE